MTYLRCTIGRWNIDLNSDEGQETLRSINDEGLRVFRSQPGFIGYRLMVAEPTTTIAVAEWESLKIPFRTGSKGVFSEVQLRAAERCSVRRVMSSSCSQPSPVKE
jgi:hypothetical protein